MSSYESRKQGPRVPPPTPGRRSLRNTVYWYLFCYFLPIGVTGSLIGLFIGALVNPERGQLVWDWIFESLALIF